MTLLSYRLSGESAPPGAFRYLNDWDIMTIATLETVTVDATARIHAATDASASIADVLARATVAGNAVISKAYGVGNDVKRNPSTAVKLAKSVADDISGASKSKGGARANVLAVLDALGDDMPTAALLVTLSRARLDALALAARAATKAKSEARASAKSVLNDRGAAKSDRIAALELMTEIDGESDRAKSDRVWGTLTKAIDAARAAGFTVEQIYSAIQ